uniref:Transmembrane and coiled-coil domain-containing protein 5B n=1 Tax=Catagonus wagneri TaxID=51154 RepID=A0A8C4FHX7_9CETA
MEEVGQDPLHDVKEMMEIPELEVTKQNLDSLNSDLEKDLQRLDEANQVLLKKIQEKEETVPSLEREINLSAGQARESEELNSIISETEEALKDLELETAKLVRRCLKQDSLMRFARSLLLLPWGPSSLFIAVSVEITAIESDYQSVYQLCEDQAHYVKKYQEILRQMEKEKEVILLEKEVIKAQNNSSQIMKPGSILVETIQSDMEKIIIKKQKRIFWYRHFRYLVFMAMIFMRLLGYVLFYLQYIHPDLLVDSLPMVMSRESLKRLRDVIFPFLTLEVEEVLPH